MKLLKKMRSREGFTLVELIVVIMIIGILAATLLPKVMRAPARARDAGRIKNLENIENALNGYYRTSNQYPTAAGCLASGDGATGDALITAGFLKSSDFPMDPSKNSEIDSNADGTSDCVNQEFYYKPLIKSGISDNAFILVAKVELDESGNAAAACINTATRVGTGAAGVDVESCLGATGDYYIKVGGA